MERSLFLITDILLDFKCEAIYLLNEEYEQNKKNIMAHELQRWSFRNCRSADSKREKILYRESFMSG